MYAIAPRRAPMDEDFDWTDAAAVDAWPGESASSQFAQRGAALRVHLREIRRQRGLSLRAVEDRTHGQISSTTLRDWENGLSRLPADSLALLGQVYLSAPTGREEPLSGGPGEMLRPVDAAAMLGVSPYTLRRWAEQGHIRMTRTAGGHRRYAASDVDEFLRPRG